MRTLQPWTIQCLSVHFLEKLGILPEKLFNNRLSHYVPRTKLSSISKRTSEKGYDSRAIHYQIILFFVACRARTENKKKREDDTVVCVFQPVAFSSSYFSQFLVKEVGYFTRSTQCKKEIGLQRKDGNTSNCLKMVAIH